MRAAYKKANRSRSPPREGRGWGRGQAARGIPPESRNRPDAGGAAARGPSEERGGRGPSQKQRDPKGREEGSESKRKTSTVQFWTGPFLPTGLSLPTWVTDIWVEACFFKSNQGTLYIRITWEPLKKADSSTPRRAASDPGPKIYLGEVWAAAGGTGPGDPTGGLPEPACFRGNEPPGRQQVGRQGQLGIPPPP